MSVALLFPGQGSQKIGMGADLHDRFELARSKLRLADQILGKSISQICFTGPEEALKSTNNTQPALFTIEAILSDLLGDHGITPSLTMGHSLGEYSALYSAGVFSFEDGLRLVAARGALMAKVGTEVPGSMAAVIGMDKSEIAEILSEMDEGLVVPANENSPDQTVISGETAAVTKACEILKARGAKRAIPLPVSGAFHSPLMQKAADEFSAHLEKVNFLQPRCPIVTNVTAQPESDPALIRQLLLKQLVSPVRWVDSVQSAAKTSPTTWIEVGPGNVLQGLVKKIAPQLSVVLCGSAENVYSLSTSR